MSFEIMKERFELAQERINTIQNELLENTKVTEEWKAYFSVQAKWLLQMFTLYERCEKGDFSKDAVKSRKLKDLLEENHALYEELEKDHYEKSYLNPQVAVKIFGKEMGEVVTFLAAELRSLIGYAFELQIESFVIRMELFLEIYGVMLNSFEEIGKQATSDEIKEILYWFVSDYSETECVDLVRKKVCPEDNFYTKLLETADFSTPEYLFTFGEYITEDDIRLSQFMSTLPEERVKLMADTYTEGYRKGFINGNKDLSKKKTVNIHSFLGFERMIKQAIENFRAMGLEPTIYRCPASVMNGRSAYRMGYCAATPNKQYEYDHKDDLALVYDRKLAGRKLEELKAAYEEYKEWAGYHAGPAVVEVFGEEPFSPASKNENIHFSDEQQKIRVEYQNLTQTMVNEYIKGEERSFTIIAFPVPAIGPKFEEIFDEIITVNTLNYETYEKIQSTIIDTLNDCVAVEVKGNNGNRTDIHVSLYPIQDQEKEAIFENCVADVNIPVGEVFTSPVLKGTNGLLHVKEVFLNELRFEDLSVWFEDGMISGYDCGNFQDPKKNKEYIHENVLFHHDTLPTGEFAIGTNTTAYMVGRNYQIQDKLPILIAEKTGPHFAVGDTCYSHSEDVKVYNPDGKEIVAKDNEKSILRKTDPSKAYFSCHTDITIPYNELGELYGLKKDGTRVDIIRDGRFVLAGCEELNIPLDK